MILDANQWHKFLNPNNEDMKPIHKWLEKKNGKLVYSTHEKIKKELNNMPKMSKRLEIYRQAGKARRIKSKNVNEKINEIKKNSKIQSDDPHILGLARASNTKLLCSSDQKLHEDFKNIIGGHIYQNKTHQKLLTRDICP